MFPKLTEKKKKKFNEGNTQDLSRFDNLNVTTKAKLVNKLCTYFEYFPLEKWGNNSYAVRLFLRKIKLYKIDT